MRIYKKMSFSSLSEPDLILEILFLQNTQIEQMKQCSEKVLDFAEDFNFQIFNEEQVLNYRAQCGDGNDVVTALQKMKFKFPFYPCFLTEIVESCELNQNIAPFAASVILRSYISWTIVFTKTKDVEYFQNILDSLNSLMGNKCFSSCGKERLLAIYAFYFAVKRYFLLIQEPDIQKYIPPITKYFSINEKLPHDIYKLFELLFNKLFITYKAPISFASKLLESIGAKIDISEFPTDVLNRILEIMTSHFVNFEPEALVFLARASASLEDCDVETFFPAVVDGLFKMINSENVFIDHHVKTNQNNKIQLDDFPSNVLVSPKHQMFNEKPDLTQLLTFQEPEPIQQRLSQDLLFKLSILESIYLRSESLSTRFVEVFSIHVLANLGDEDAILYLTVLTQIVLTIYNKFPVYVPTNVLWNDVIFPGDVDGFHPNEDYEFLSTYRSYFVRFMLTPRKCTCSTVFLKAAEYPYIFTELVHRLVQFPLQKVIDPAKAAQLTVGLMNPLIQYRSMEGEGVVMARKAIIMFIIRSFRIPEISRSFFAFKDFILKFSTLMFEPSLSRDAITIFFNYMSSSEQIYNIQDIVDISRLLVTAVFDEMELRQALQVMSAFLYELNDVLTMKSQYANNFTALIEPLCKETIKLDVTSLSEDFLIQVISFMAVTSPEHTIKIRELTAIEAAIMKLNNNNPTNDIMIKLAQLMAKRTLSFVLPNFDIQQPKVLTLFLRIYLKSDKLPDAIEFLIRLCEYSPENCSMCHQGDLDLFILETLDVWRVTGEMPKEVVKRMLHLLLMIILVTVSVSVLQKYISLFCPIAGRNLPFYFTEIAETFNTALLYVNKNPISVNLLDANSIIKVSGVLPEQINDGFTFSFWFYPIPSAVVGWKQTILCINDSIGHLIKFVFQQKSLTARIYDGNDHYKGSFEIPYKNLVWQLITISFAPPNDDLGSIISVSLNGEALKRVSRFPLLVFKAPIEVTLNKANTMRPVMEKPSRIGAMTLCSLLKDYDVQGIIDDGPRGCNSAPKGIIFYLEATQINGAITVVNRFTQGLKIEAPHRPVRENTDFASILVNMVKLENIMPMFALIDLNDPNNNHVPFLGETILDILQNFLALGEVPQKYFIEANGFQIISHLLSKSNATNFTYKMYLRYYALTQVLVIPELQEELYDSIILNINLWIRANPKNHLMILKHWARSVFEKEAELPRKIRSFRWMLYILKVYYFYKPGEDGQFTVKDRCNGEEMLVDECRRVIFDIMTSYVNESFTEYDYNCLIFHAITSKEENQTTSLLGYLSTLVFSRETPKFFYEFVFNNFKPLYKFLEEPHDARVILVLNIITEMYAKLPEKREKFGRQIIEVMKLLNPTIMKESLFMQIVTLTNSGNPELLPLCILVSANAGGQCPLLLLSMLKKGISYNCNSVSILWGVIWIFITSCYEKGNIESLIDFLLISFQGSWLKLFNIITIVGKSFNTPVLTSRLRFLFLKHAIANINEKNPSELNEVIVIGRNSILLQPSGTSNLFKKEKPTPQRRTIVFSRPKPESSELKKLFSYPVLVQDIIEKSGLNTYTEPKMVFGLRMGPVGGKIVKREEFGVNIEEKSVWLDLENAKELIKLISRNCNNDRVIDLLIYSYFVRKIEGWKPVSFSFPMFDIRNVYPIHDDVIQFAESIIKEDSDCRKAGLLLDTVVQLSADSRRLNMGESALEVYKQNFLFFGNLKYTKDIEKLQEIYWAELTHYDDVKRNQSTKRRKKWFKLWRSVTVDFAPWNGSLPIEMRKVVRYKRDNKACAYFCPAKLRQNFAFNDHMEASLTRDSGNALYAKQKVSAMREEMRVAHSSSSFISITQDDEEPAEIDDSSTKTKDSIAFDEIKQRTMCMLIKIKKEVLAAFIVTDQTIKIICQTGKVIFIRAEDIKMILYRTYRHRRDSIEIFTVDGDSYFVRFMELWQFEALMAQISTKLTKIRPTAMIQNVGFQHFFEKSGFTEKWVRREISNFEYLMMINIMSGRSFNVASQYPIFPWVLSDFSSSELDLNNPKVYRDLSKPIGALNEKRLEQLHMKYNELQEIGLKPYLYGNSPMFPLSVYQWLIRMEPFTSMHIDIQGGRFDQAARLFISIKDAFRQVSEQMGDYRELIPEFYFMSEFLDNMNGFDLGKTDKEKLGDVVLPDWAHGNKFEFIYLHRKAFESEYVSQHINDWIDLLWGYKQKGSEALKANNVFKMEMYPEVWDEVKKSRSTSNFDSVEIDLFLDQMGQIPQQIFTAPHPKRNPVTMKPSLIAPAMIRDDLGTITACSCSFKSNSTICSIKYLTDSFIMSEVSYNLANLFTDGCSVPISSRSRSIADVSSNIASEPKPLFIGEGIAYFTNDANTIFLPKFVPSEDTTIDSQVLLSAINGNKRWVVGAGKDSTISVFNTETKRIMQTLSFRGEVECIGLSNIFDELICGTKEGVLIFMSLSRCSISRIVNLGQYTILSILVTSSLGFVLVHTRKAVKGTLKYGIHLFSINGEKIREVESPSIACWHSWESKDGFDHVLACCTDGSCYSFEAFYLNIPSEPIIRFPAPAIAISNSKHSPAAVAVCSDGKVYALPVKA